MSICKKYDTPKL